MIEPLALLELAEALHRRGHQRLRIAPSMAPSGMHWRLALSAPGTADTAAWSTGADAVPAVDEVLATHPTLAEHGRGADQAYAAWLSRVVELAREGWVAYFVADWPTDEVVGVPLLGPVERKPVLEEPPGGR